METNTNSYTVEEQTNIIKGLKKTLKEKQTILKDIKKVDKMSKAILRNKHLYDALMIELAVKNEKTLPAMIKDYNKFIKKTKDLIVLCNANLVLLKQKQALKAVIN